MRKTLSQSLAAAMAVSIVAPAALAATLHRVTLDAQAVSAGQIRTIGLKRLDAAPRVSAYGRVINPGPLVTLASQVIAARSAVDAARAEAALARSAAVRAAGLYRARHNISLAALQRARASLAVAEAKRASAVARLVQFKTRMLARWGVRLSAAALSARAPLPELETGAAALVEVSLPLGESLRHPPARAQAMTPDGERLRLHLISRAPGTMAVGAGEGLFYLAPTRTSAPIGTPLTMHLEASPTEEGVMVPRFAVIWHRGEPLVFRETAPGSFAPTPIRGHLISSRGYFVPTHAQSLRPGDRIVTRGTALLYSAAVQTPPAAEAAHGDRVKDQDND